MSQEIDHIELANRNHDTLLYLVQDAATHSEWVATVAFYKAVHVVEAVFAAQAGKHSHGHDDRLGSLKYPEYAAMFKAYRPLYAASLVARYLEDASDRKIDGKGGIRKYHRFSDYLSPADVVRGLLRKRLDVLEQHAVGYLSDAGKSSLKRICNAQLA